MSACTYCKTVAHSRPRHRIQRYGGGTWRRPGRWYRGQICVRCARSLLACCSTLPHPGGWLSRYPVWRLMEIAAS